MGVITIPEVLRERLGSEGADAFAEVIRGVDLEARKDAIVIAEERFERRLVEETSKINERTTIEIGKVSAEIGKVNERITIEIGKVNVEMAKINERITIEVGKVNERITTEMVKVNERISEETRKLRLDMAEMRADIIKWMFIFWVGQIGVLLAIIFTTIRLLRL